MASEFSPRDLVPAAGVFVVALAYLWLLRPYGFQLEDEGTLLFWFDRAARGERPYVDFHTGYTPGFFAFGKAVFAMFGTSATALRGVLAVMNALSAAAMTELTRRAAGRWIAPIPALLWLAFMPVYVGEFAAFNVPYPTWPVTLATVALAFALLGWIERRRSSSLVLAGAACAFAMWLRPNSGAFALAAATWLAVAASERRSYADRIAAPAAAAFMALGVWYTFTFRVTGVDALVHLLPALVLVVLLTGPVARRLAFDDDAAPVAQRPGTTTALAWLAAAFLIPTLAWTLPLLATLGAERFVAEVFLVGADVQTIYYNAQPPPEPYALFVVAAVVAIAAAGRAVANGRVRPLAVFGIVALLGGVAKLMLFRESLAPEGVLHSIVAQLENSSFWLAAVANYGAVIWLALAGAEELRTSVRARTLVALTPVAAAMYMQVFPRNDFMHQITAVPMTAVVACALLERVASWWSRGSWPRGWEPKRTVRTAIVAAGCAIAAIAVADKIGGPLEAALFDAAPKTAMPARLDVHVEEAAGDELEAIASILVFLGARTVENETLWAFPATTGLLFASGRRNAVPHDYWYPGRPDHVEEERLLASIRETRPRFLVTLNKGWNFFGGAPSYFEATRSYVAAEYRLAARHGRYDVLGRRDIVEGDASLPIVAAIVPAASTGARSLVEPNLERRRQAAWRWMETMTPAEAAAAALPDDRRAALLLLRGIRDGGNMRAAAWAIAGFRSNDARIRGEAVDAMAALVRALDAERSRLANDFGADAYRPYVAPHADAARELEPIERLKPFADAVAQLAAGL